MLRLEHVGRKLGDFELRDITFTIPDGYICGLIGENGAGKTTLLHLILGLYPAGTGLVEVDGHRLPQEERAVKDSMGFVLNEKVFTGGMTLAENADFYGKYYRNYERPLFDGLCGRFGLDGARRLRKLSKGEKLKFQFAFALSHHPKLLLLDEPTASFDPEFRQEFLEIITAFVADGARSVVLSTHVTEDLDRVADYVVFLKEGKLVFCKDRGEMENSYRMVSGTAEQISLLPRNRVIWKHLGEYVSRALVEYGKTPFYEKDLDLEVPSLEDIMYGYSKGGKNDDKTYH